MQIKLIVDVVVVVVVVVDVGVKIVVVISLLETTSHPLLGEFNVQWGTSLHTPHRYVPLQRVSFLRCFGLKTGTDFAHFGLESDMVFEGTKRGNKSICRFNSI